VLWFWVANSIRSLSLWHSVQKFLA